MKYLLLNPILINIFPKLEYKRVLKNFLLDNSL